jgi:hypothetical protein
MALTVTAMYFLRSGGRDREEVLEAGDLLGFFRLLLNGKEGKEGEEQEQEQVKRRRGWFRVFVASRVVVSCS